MTKQDLCIRCIPDLVEADFHLFKGAKVIASSHSEEYLTAIQNCIEALELLRRRDYLDCIAGDPCGDCTVCKATKALEAFENV